MKRRLLSLGIALLGVIALALAAIAWVIDTQSGARFAIKELQHRLDGKLTVQSVAGKIAGPMVLNSLHYDGGADSLSVSANRISVDVNLSALFGWLIDIDSLDVDGLVVSLATTNAPPQNQQPFSLQPPIGIDLNHAVLNNAWLKRGNETLASLNRAEAAGRWTDSELRIDKLEAYAPQGEIHLAGHAAQQVTYSGAASGRFRWTVGTQTYAGTLTSNATSRVVSTDTQLSSPFNARLHFELQQQASLPWSFNLQVPRFDPHDWMQSESITSLAVALRGSGTRTEATLSGDASINDQKIELQRLQASLAPQRIELRTLDMRIAQSPGVLHAQGDVQLQAPLTAALNVSWNDVRLPSSWVGQELATHGKLAVNGGLQSYSVDGAFALGPPGRLANVVLNADGSADAVQLHTLRIQQAKGFWQARGKLQYRPAIKWQLTTQARRFDPGELFANWRGDLNIDLDTQGEHNDAATHASLQLKQLGGHLRGRAVSGSGSLQFDTPASLAGDLQLHADSSTLHFSGQRGDQLNAEITVAVNSLNDWLPDTGGRLNARFTASGRWPQLDIAGSAQGNKLRMSTLAIDNLVLGMDVRNPLHPEGVVRLTLNDAGVANFNFANLNAFLSGNEAAHSLQIDAEGSPLSVNAHIDGSRKQDAWTGTLQQLALQIADAEKLQLQQPAALAYSKDTVKLAETCLRGSSALICLQADSAADGALAVNYRLQNVPLAYATLAAPDLPLRFDGELAGEGTVQHATTGEWSGHANLHSDRGGVAYSSAPDSEAQNLLGYANLQAEATLSGTQAQASLTTQLDQTGHLNAKLSLSGLNAAPAALNGHIDLSMPKLNAVTLFAPQLANVSGHAQLTVNLSGTVNAPAISGQLRAADIGAQVPVLGIQIKNGELQASPGNNGDIAIAGAFTSGDGTIKLDGQWTHDKQLQLSIDGERFTAANIPSASVLVSPALKFSGVNGQFNLNGQVQIPEANINIQKLPRGKRAQRASPDVVVVDAKAQATQAQNTPPTANINVLLGDKVKVVGYGLDANMTGQLSVHEQPGEITRGSGTIAVNGTYKAYGQDLTIQQGHVLYADASLDNPQLDITATRQVDTVTAGLRIGGTAQQPQLTVFSNPEMGEADALAYLVTGKPLDQIGTGGSDDTSALQSAAQSLETAGGGLLAKKIGKRLGISEVGIEKNDLVGGETFTVGQYLSPRLFLSYGIGLFEPGEVVTLRYRLSKALSLEAQRGSEETRTGIEFKQER